MLDQIRQGLFAEIEVERCRQDAMWGTEFDDKNTANDWAAYINRYVAKVTEPKATPDDQRDNMLKVAALAVAAAEAICRNECFPPRHYESYE